MDVGICEIRTPRRCWAEKVAQLGWQEGQAALVRDITLETGARICMKPGFYISFTESGTYCALGSVMLTWCHMFQVLVVTERDMGGVIECMMTSKDKQI